MFQFLKNAWEALREGVSLSYMAMQYSDPEELRKAMLIAMGAVLPENTVKAKRPAEPERELIAA